MPGTTISIYIPAYNAQASLEKVIAALPATIWPRIQACYVINDGSTDETGAIAAHLAKSNPKIVVVQFVRNQGYGAVVRHGLALCRNDGCSVAVCLHGDGQYPARLVETFADTLLTEGLDLLQGSRHADPHGARSGHMPLYKIIAGTLLCRLENAILGLRLTDYHSGFLLFSRRALQQLPVGKCTGDFDVDLELIVAARRCGLTIAERPIPTRYAGEISYLHPLRYGLAVLGVLGRYLTGGYAA